MINLQGVVYKIASKKVIKSGALRLFRSRQDQNYTLYTLHTSNP